MLQSYPYLQSNSHAEGAAVTITASAASIVEGAAKMPAEEVEGAQLIARGPDSIAAEATQIAGGAIAGVAQHPVGGTVEVANHISSITRAVVTDAL